MLCKGENSSNSSSLVDNLAVFIAVSSLLLLSILLFALFKFVLVKQTQIKSKYFQVRWFTQIIATHVGCVLLGITTLPDLDICQLNALSVLAPALLILPPAIRVFNFRQQYLLTATAATEANGVTETLTSPRGSMVPAILSVSQFTVLNRIFKATFRGKLQRADLDVETLRRLRGLAKGAWAIKVLVLCILPFLVCFIVLLATEASTEAIVIVRATAYAICLFVFALALARSWRLPDPFFVVLEAKVCAIVFLPSTVALALRDMSEAMIPAMFYCLTHSLFALFAIFLQDWWKRRQRRLWWKSEESALAMPRFANTAEEFDHCLADAALHEAFFLHLTAEHSVDSLVFYDEVNKWSREYHDMGPRTAFIRARRIVQCYVGDEAMFPVNLPGDLIVKLRSTVDPHYAARHSIGNALPAKKKLSLQASFRSAKKSSSLIDLPAAALSSSLQAPMDGTSPPNSLGSQSKIARAMSSLRRYTSYSSVDENGGNAMMPPMLAIDDLEANSAPPPSPPPAPAPTQATSLTVNKDFFDEAEKQIKFLMRMDGFNRFKKTRRYHELQIEKAKRLQEQQSPAPQAMLGVMMKKRRSKE